MRLIDADALADKVDESKYINPHPQIKLRVNHRNEHDHFLKMIMEAHTVDAVPVVHGRWLSAYEYAQKLGVTDKEKLEEVKADKWWKFCNHCDQQVKGFHNYCPNCGADMRERSEGE